MKETNMKLIPGMIVPRPTKITEPIEDECMRDLETMGVTAENWWKNESSYEFCAMLVVMAKIHNKELLSYFNYSDLFLEHWRQFLQKILA